MVWVWLMALMACDPDDGVALDPPTSDTSTPSTTFTGEGTPWVWDLPDGFPRPMVPEGNPMTVEKVELGRHLFYDTRLSLNQTQACASCHEQARGFTDGRSLPLGSTGEEGVRNAMGLTNVAYHSTITWSNPVLLTFEQQILVPLFGEFPVELGLAGHEEEVLARLADDPLYVELFAGAYPELVAEERVDWNLTVDALACFVRALVSWNTPYDDLSYRGQGDALTEGQRRGLELFFSERLECHHCHGGPLFSGSFQTEFTVQPERPFLNTGLYNIDGEGSYPPDNTGLFLFTGEPTDMGAFRPPTLRNLVHTAPYMHDGSVETLEEVLDIYADGGRLITEGPYAGDGRASPYKSPFVPGFELTEQERADMVDFLENALRDDTLIDDPRFSNPFE